MPLLRERVELEARRLFRQRPAPRCVPVVDRVAERRAIQRPGGQIDMMSMPTNSVTVWADVRRWASNSARRLRAELDDALAGE